MKNKNPIIQAAAMAAFLGLAGCGGGSSSTPPADPGPTPGETAAERVEMQAGAIRIASSALTAAVAGLDGANPTQGQIDAVDSAITDLQNALAAAVDVDDAVKDGYQAEVASARQIAMNADDALMAAEAAAAREAAAAMKAMARRLYNGLPHVGAPTNPTPEQAANSALWRSGFLSRSSTEVRVDPVFQRGNPNAITLRKTGTVVPDDPGGWPGDEYVRTSGGVTDRVVLYNGQGTDSEPFSEKHGGLIDSGTGDDLGTYSISQANLVADTNERFVAAGDFATSGTEDHTAADDDEVTVSGTFDGVSGTYSCTQAGGTACSSTVDDDENIVLAGGWTFSGFSLDAMTRTPDTAYLMYGWWTRESSAGIDVSRLGPFNGVQPANNVAARADFYGTATYKGGAAGQYAIYNPFGDDSRAGAFTASAELVADFTAKRMSGKLTDFMSDGESLDWEVSLNAGVITPGGYGNGGVGYGTTFRTVWSMDGVADNPRGEWQANFHKSNGAGPTDEETVTPAAVSGLFDAEYQVGGLGIGRMSGSFAAEEE